MIKASTRIFMSTILGLYFTLISCAVQASPSDLENESAEVEKTIKEMAQQISPKQGNQTSFTNQLREHLHFLQERLPQNPEDYFSKAQEVGPTQGNELDHALGDQSQGVVFRQGQVDKEKPFNLNYQIKIDRQNETGHIGPFNYKVIKQKKVTPENGNEKDSEKDFKNLTLELGSIYIDLYEIENADYLIGNVYLRNENGQLEYFGQTLIQKVKG